MARADVRSRRILTGGRYVPGHALNDDEQRRHLADLQPFHQIRTLVGIDANEPEGRVIRLSPPAFAHDLQRLVDSEAVRDPTNCEIYPPQRLCGQ
jgi:hypothetical protein